MEERNFKVCPDTSIKGMHSSMNGHIVFPVVNNHEKNGNLESNGTTKTAIMIEDRLSPSKTNTTAWANTPEKTEIDLPAQHTTCCCFAYIKKNRLKEKFVFMVSVISLVILAYAVLYEQWFLPYYYSVSALLLLMCRFIIYIQKKWLLFMLDFCYFANTLCFFFIWAAPNAGEVFAIVFACANGPLPWATFIFRNSMVFHSFDKMTSIYIHVLPMFLSFSIRWYSPVISEYWYTDFLNTFDESLGFIFIWTFAVPLAAYIVHTICLFTCVQLVCRPSEEHVDTYRYLSAADNGWTSRLFSCLGPRTVNLTK